MVLGIKNMWRIETTNPNGIWERFFQSITIPSLVLTISIGMVFISDMDMEISVFYGFKYLLILVAIIPFQYFNLKENGYLFFALLPGFVFVLFYDDLHQIFKTGYHQSEVLDIGYLFLDLVSMPFYFFCLGIFLIMKATVLKSVSERETLLSGIEEDKELIEFQRHELEEEKMRSGNAFNLISDQKNEIESINTTLRSKLITKNNLLKHTNEELIKHNGELRQFSFMVSHNLRSPVAALKGLFNLINEPEHERNDLIGKMGEVLVNLDNLMFDLSKITNIRNEVYRTNEKVDLKEELEDIKQLLYSDIKTHKVNIEADFSQQRYVHSVRSIVNSILFNLISNGIKYHSKGRDPRIQIRTEEANGFTVLKVKDFGIGLDVKKNRKKLFKLYSRFNQDVEGRGLGLYLCRMQIESLGGEIDVQSEVGEWTEFTVRFENSMDVDRQVFFENQSAVIYHDTKSGMNTVNWKRDIVFGSYKEIYSHIVALQSQYLPESWIFDCSNQGHVPLEFHLWMRKNIVPSLDSSLREIHLILHDGVEDDLKVEFSKTVKLLEKQSVRVHVLDSKTEE